MSSQTASGGGPLAGASIAAMIARFRSERPMTREERGRTRTAANEREFWWKSGREGGAPGGALWVTGASLESSSGGGGGDGGMHNRMGGGGGGGGDEFVRLGASGTGSLGARTGGAELHGGLTLDGRHATAAGGGGGRAPRHDDGIPDEVLLMSSLPRLSHRPRYADVPPAPTHATAAAAGTRDDGGDAGAGGTTRRSIEALPMVADAPGGGGGAPPRARPPLSADVDMREADLGSRFDATGLSRPVPAPAAAAPDTKTAEQVTEEMKAVLTRLQQRIARHTAVRADSPPLDDWGGGGDVDGDESWASSDGGGGGAGASAPGGGGGGGGDARAVGLHDVVATITDKLDLGLGRLTSRLEALDAAARAAERAAADAGDGWGREEASAPPPARSGAFDSSELRALLAASGDGAALRQSRDSMGSSGGGASRAMVRTSASPVGGPPVTAAAAPATPPAGAGAPPAFARDERVEVRYRGLDLWFPAEVTAVGADGTFDVRYEDGDREFGVRRELVRPRGGGGGGLLVVPPMASMAASPPRGRDGPREAPAPVRASAPARVSGGSAGARLGGGGGGGDWGLHTRIGVGAVAGAAGPSEVAMAATRGGAGDGGVHSRVGGGGASAIAAAAAEVERARLSVEDFLRAAPLAAAPPGPPASSPAAGRGATGREAPDRAAGGAAAAGAPQSRTAGGALPAAAPPPNMPRGAGGGTGGGGGDVRAAADATRGGIVAPSPSAYPRFPFPVRRPYDDDAGGASLLWPLARSDEAPAARGAAVDFSHYAPASAAVHDARGGGGGGEWLGAIAAPPYAGPVTPLPHTAAALRLAPPPPRQPAAAAATLGAGTGDWHASASRGPLVAPWATRAAVDAGIAAAENAVRARAAAGGRDIAGGLAAAAAARERADAAASDMVARAIAAERAAWGAATAPAPAPPQRWGARGDETAWARGGDVAFAPWATAPTTRGWPGAPQTATATPHTRAAAAPLAGTAPRWEAASGSAPARAPRAAFGDAFAQLDAFAAARMRTTAALAQ